MLNRFIHHPPLAFAILCTVLAAIHTYAESNIFNQEDGHVLNTQKFGQASNPFGSQDFQQKLPDQNHADPMSEFQVQRMQEDILADLLREFEGRWVGQMSVKTLEGQVVNTFQVEQQYWWNEEKRELEGLAVFEDAGILRYAQTTNLIRDGIIISEVKEGAMEHTYQAKMEGEGIVWLPMERARALDHQLSQKIYTTEEGIFMLNKGYERYKRGPIDKMLLVQGNLKKEE